MAGGIGPPQDSTRRALVGTAENESSRTKPWKSAKALSTPSFGRAVAASRPMNGPAKNKDAGPPLTPRPHAAGVVSLNCA